MNWFGRKARRTQPPTLVEVSEYTGQPTVRVACTQLDSDYATASRQRRIVQGWVDFFSAGPSGITDL